MHGRVFFPESDGGESQVVGFEQNRLNHPFTFLARNDFAFCHDDKRLFVVLSMYNCLTNPDCSYGDFKNVVQRLAVLDCLFSVSLFISQRNELVREGLVSERCTS